ncbi:hypothetical protein [Flavobacterium rhizosphaerae]|uniref:Uncharacterized protein n=1 Tax=Flavobacterium rhizosphaerae TaxID=3163298 RepID=A0ABW8YZE2_9FLAO
MKTQNRSHDYKEVKTLKAATAEKAKGETTPTKEETKAETVIVPTAAQRLINAQKFAILGTKFEQLKAKGDALERFILSNDGTREKLTLSNQEGFIFEISNTMTISKVLGVVKEDVNTLIQKAETQIMEFTI